MTNCNIIGECNLSSISYPKKRKKKIKFEFKVSVVNGISETAVCADPDKYDNITLISKNSVMYKEKIYDLMYACECFTCGHGPGKGFLYIGYWNDGIVNIKG